MLAARATVANLACVAIEPLGARGALHQDANVCSEHRGLVQCFGDIEGHWDGLQRSVDDQERL
jgi:hypothetical protein